MAKKINELSGMPQVSAAFAGWNTTITLVKVTQTIVDGDAVNTEVQLSYKGTVQPLSEEAIKLKPEGQRSWEWLQVHVIASDANDLKTNDRVLYNGKKYKVMQLKDYSLNNYIEYHLLEDYVDAA